MLCMFVWGVCVSVCGCSTFKHTQGKQARCRRSHALTKLTGMRGGRAPPHLVDVVEEAVYGEVPAEGVLLGRAKLHLRGA